MAAPSTPSQGSVFERSDRYRDLNQIALETKPAGTFEGDVFAVAVLYHEKDASNAVGSDFIWFKVKSVGYIFSTYKFCQFLTILFRSTQFQSSAKHTMPEPESR